MLNFFAADEGLGAEQIILFVLLALLVVVFLVLPMFTNRRKQKSFSDMLGAVAPGCVIKTVSGLICKVITVNEITPLDKEIVVESGVGDNKSTLVFDIQCVLQIMRMPDGSPYAPATTITKLDESNTFESQSNSESVTSSESAETELVAVPNENEVTE